MSTLQINKTKYKQFKIAAISSGAALALGGLAFFQPLSLSNNSYAETATSSTSTEMSVNLDPTITIWTTDTSNNNIDSINIAADPDESVYTGAGRVHVSTNNLTGYTLTIQSNSTDAKMKHENESVTKTINPITGSGTSSSSWASNSSLNNMWGYSLGSNDSYVGVPGSASSATTIDSTDAPNSDNYTDITFATKADLSLPAGTYTDTVIFSAVANALPVEYMQDADASWCAGLDTWTPSNNAEYTLKDSRDNLEYKIRKLKDGHCWMVQNLKLGSTSTMTLTNTDTDITADSWTLPASSTISGSYDAAQMHVGTTSDSNWTAIYGNYYNWPAATAGQGTSSTSSGDINVSICPKGWKLPKNSGDYSWYNLYTTGYSSNQANFRSATNTGTGYWSGYYYNGSLYYAGSYGYWWSRTAYSASDAYYLYSGSSVVSPQDYDYKRGGNSVRCVLSST